MVFINLSTDNKSRPIGSDIFRLRWSSILLWTLNLSITGSLGSCDFLLALPCVKISQILWDICQHLPILLSTLGYPWGTYTWCHSWFKLMIYIQLRAVNVVMPSLAFSIHLYIRYDWTFITTACICCGELKVHALAPFHIQLYEHVYQYTSWMVQLIFLLSKK